METESKGGVMKKLLIALALALSTVGAQGAATLDASKLVVTDSAKRLVSYAGASPTACTNQFVRSIVISSAGAVTWPCVSIADADVAGVTSMPALVAVGAITSSGVITAATSHADTGGYALSGSTVNGFRTYSTGLYGISNNSAASGTCDTAWSRVSANVIAFGNCTQGNGSAEIRAALVVATNHSGTVTNNDAAAGSIGEYVTANVASGSPVSLTTGTTANVTSISLTAGDWDVSGVVGFTGGATTTVSYMGSGVSSTSATQVAFQQTKQVYNPAAALIVVDEPRLPTPIVRFSLASTTTIYLVATAGFATSTYSAYGLIRARRMR